MAYQVSSNNLGSKPNQDYFNGPYQFQKFLDISMNFTNNLTILILIIIVSVLLLSKAMSDKLLISTSEKKKTIQKMPKAKLLLPFRLPVIDSIYNMVKFRKDGLEFFERLSEKYGNLVELPFGPSTFAVVSDPVIIQKLLSSSQLAYLNRPKIYKSIFGDIFHDGLLTSENEIWHAQRKMLGRSFTYKSLQNYATFMNTHAANLTSSLVLECGDNKAVEVQRFNQLLCYHSFKIIAQIVMGSDSISLDGGNDFAEYFNCFCSMKDHNAEKVFSPWKFLLFLSKTREYNRTNKYLTDFFMKITQEYKKEHEKMKITSSAHQSKSSSTEGENEDESVGVKPFRCMIEEMLCGGASEPEIFQQVGTILVTGQDTTVIATQMLMVHLALNPDHQVACREEIDKIIDKRDRKHNTYNCRDKINSFDLKLEDLHDLKYLERCILETNRITPAIPIFLRRIDAPLKIDDDLEFPTGTNFAISTWVLHRDSQIYPNPLKFDPDRFLAENVKKRHPYSYTAFSMGPRNCIGSKVAIMQMKVIMTYVLRHFEIFCDDKLENVKMHFGVSLLPDRDFKITLRQRGQPSL